MKNNLNDQFLSRKKNRYFLKHIATIFVRLEISFNTKFKNSTPFLFATDCLTEESRKLLFRTVAHTLETNIIDLLELKPGYAISSENALNILEETISMSSQRFILAHLTEHYSYCELLDPALNFSLCDLVLWNHILNYFYTGNAQLLEKQHSIALSRDLLEEHLLALLGHFVIKLSNIIMDSILSSSELALTRSYLPHICSSIYLSQRHLINLKNNLLLFKGLNFYIHDPKLIYENKYPLFHLESGLICQKNIYSDRQKEMLLLVRPQLVILLLLEIQDLILPKLRNFVYLLGKSLIYVFSYVLGAIIKILRSKSD
nr:Ycf55 [Porphyrostromium boryanum]